MSLQHSNIVQVLDLGVAGGPLLPGAGAGRRLGPRAASCSAPTTAGMVFPPALALYVVARACAARSPTRTARRATASRWASSTATSAPTTSSSASRARSSWPTSASPRRSASASRPRPASSRARSRTCRPSRRTGAVDRQAVRHLLGRVDAVPDDDRQAAVRGARRSRVAAARAEGGRSRRPRRSSRRVGPGRVGASSCARCGWRPAERYQTADEMLVDVERVLRTEFQSAGQTELKLWLEQLARRDKAPIDRASAALDTSGVVKDEVGTDLSAGTSFELRRRRAGRLGQTELQRGRRRTPDARRRRGRAAVERASRGSPPRGLTPPPPRRAPRRRAGARAGSGWASIFALGGGGRRPLRAGLGGAPGRDRRAGPRRRRATTRRRAGPAPAPAPTTPAPRRARADGARPHRTARHRGCARAGGDAGAPTLGARRRRADGDTAAPKPRDARAAGRRGPPRSDDAARPRPPRRPRRPRTTRPDEEALLRKTPCPTPRARSSARTRPRRRRDRGRAPRSRGPAPPSDSAKPAAQAAAPRSRASRPRSCTSPARPRARWCDEGAGPRPHADQPALPDRQHLRADAHQERLPAGDAARVAVHNAKDRKVARGAEEAPGRREASARSSTRTDDDAAARPTLARSPRVAPRVVRCARGRRRAGAARAAGAAPAPATDSTALARPPRCARDRARRARAAARTSVARGDLPSIERLVEDADARARARHQRRRATTPSCATRWRRRAPTPTGSPGGDDPYRHARPARW